LSSSGPKSNFWLVDQQRALHGAVTLDVMPVCGGSFAPLSVFATSSDAWFGSYVGDVCHLESDGGFEVLTGFTQTSNELVWSDGVDLWVATSAGIFRADAGAEYVSTSGYAINTLAGLDSTHLWAGTEDGLVLSRQADGGWSSVSTSGAAIVDISVVSATEAWASRRGALPLLLGTGAPMSVSFPTGSPTLAYGVRGSDAGLLVFGYASNGVDGVVTRLVRHGH
jgi:hypothetical protein